ncbi:GFA family protein [Tepidamorphus sp. 3E244]|uniref:GFA family protein n=1 Tax=Tepidamorphus sp. 3E244 TaxID=3385498 RepID=UPI0038FC11C8
MRRGFCEACGTPLSFDYGGEMEVSIGSLDDPTLAAPAIQVNAEPRLPFVDGLADLPHRKSEDEPKIAEFMAGIISYQHPDHDTNEWPPKDGRPEDEL